MRALHHIVVTPVGYVDEESPLAQEVTRDLIEKGDDAPERVESEGENAARSRAAKLLAQMRGWDKSKDDPMAKAVDTMAEMVRMIREGKKA